MNWPPILRDSSFLLFAGALLYSGVRIWRGKKRAGRRGHDVDFRPSVGFSWQDGFRSAALLLANKSDTPVWTEEVEIALTDLRANEQASEASCRETLKIRQTVIPQDMLPISLVETVYLAAGKPQREYSCKMSSVVRFRVGEKWYEEIMPVYKLEMIGLTVADIRPDRGPSFDFKSPYKPGDMNPATPRTK